MIVPVLSRSTRGLRRLKELHMRIKGLLRNGLQSASWIVDGLWVIGEPISGYKDAVEKETGILTEFWLLWLDHFSGPWLMAQGHTIAIWSPGPQARWRSGVLLARKGNTPEYVSRMQQDLFNIWARQGFLLDNQNAQIMYSNSIIIINSTLSHNNLTFLAPGAILGICAAATSAETKSPLLSNCDQIGKRHSEIKREHRAQRTDIWYVDGVGITRIWHT